MWKLVDMLKEKILRQSLRRYVNASPNITSITLIGAWSGERKRKFNSIHNFLKESLQGRDTVEPARDRSMVGVTFAALKGGSLTWKNSEN
jgi:hypothetical protein